MIFLRISESAHSNLTVYHKMTKGVSGRCATSVPYVPVSYIVSSEHTVTQLHNL